MNRKPEALAPGFRAAKAIRGVSVMRGQNVAARLFDAKSFDSGQLEGDIRDAVQQRPPHIQAVEIVPRPAEPELPDYVSHRDDVSEIGKLSAEAMASMLKDIKATTTRYRQEGKPIFNEIEFCSSATDEVRKLCEAFRDEIAAKTAEGAS
ncbi:MAG TPA: hypothetical protein VGI20_07600 [Rhizomicrobium sp.]